MGKAGPSTRDTRMYSRFLFSTRYATHSPDDGDWKSREKIAEIERHTEPATR